MPVYIESMTPTELKAWRTENSLSQRALAKRVGWHWRSIQEYEAGNVVIPFKFEVALRGVQASVEG